MYKHWFSAHSATDVAKWMNTTNMYQVKTTWNYEPYIVVSLKHVPLFDERFIVYGDDKTQWHRHLSFLGYEYWILPKSFIIHLPHKPHVWAGKERQVVYALVRKWIKEFSADLTGVKSSSAVLGVPSFWVVGGLLVFLVFL